MSSDIQPEGGGPEPNGPASNSDVGATANEESPRPLADDALPPVEPPSSGFLLQLFVIPLLIVGIMIALGFLFSWLGQGGRDPKALVARLRDGGTSSWVQASDLAAVMSNPNNRELRRDPQVAKELATVLEGHLKDPLPPRGQKARFGSELKIRIYLAKALGEMEVEEGLPVLIKAAQLERDTPVNGELSEVHVRISALEALAVRASNLPPSLFRDNPELMDTLIKASSEKSRFDDTEENRKRDDYDKPQRDQVRWTAAFALGVVGGKQALDQLEKLLYDPHPNVKYNAATGLARHGDLRAKTVLLAMLDPENDTPLAGEDGASGKRWKRATVLLNGIKATEQLVRANPQAPVDDLVRAVEALAGGDSAAPTIVRGQAKATLQEIENIKGGGER